MKEAIARDIVEGRSRPGTRLPPTVQIAREYGVCHKTVQLAMKALAGEGLLIRRPRLGTVVANVCLEDLARRAGARRVALLMPYLLEDFKSSQFVRELIMGVVSEAEQCGCGVDFSVYSNSHSLAIQPSLLGLLLLRPERDEALRVKRLGMPTIVLDRSHPRLGLGSVQTDNVDGIAQAARHLVSLGHKRILYVHNHRPSNPTFSAGERFRGFGLAVKRHSLPSDGYTVVVDELGVRLERRDFTAILTDGYDATVQSLRALRERSIRFPEDVSFVGFDDVDLAEHMPAPLTVIRQNLDTVGATGLRHLLDEDIDWRKARTLVKPELVVRASTKALK